MQGSFDVESTINLSWSLFNLVLVWFHMEQDGAAGAGRLVESSSLTWRIPTNLPVLGRLLEVLSWLSGWVSEFNLAHKLASICLRFPPVGFKGSLSLVFLFFFPAGLSKWKLLAEDQFGQRG